MKRTSSRADHPWATKRRRRSLFRTLVLVAVVFLVFYYYVRHEQPTTTPIAAEPAQRKAVCPESRLADDTLVIIRTGATEALEKLPIHFATTLRCIPNFVIYSDYEEEVEGHHVEDVLLGVDNLIKDTVPEFKLYNQLRGNGREGMSTDVLHGSGPAGAMENPGWKLDKWKFLPMVDRAYHHKPDAKWFVFLEPDTYMVWPNLLRYLGTFDADKPHYIGKHMFIGDTNFAHGGSGFALSAPALSKVTRYWKEHRAELNELTEQQWAGDMILGKALKNVDIPLFTAFPHFQGDALPTLDHNITKLDRQPWCFAPITYHHMRTEHIRSIWDFEQNWHAQPRDGAVLRHRDVFKRFVQPQLRAERRDWDNLSTGTVYSDETLAQIPAEGKASLSRLEQEAQDSFENCQAICRNQTACLQFSYSPGKCAVSKELKLGYAATVQCLEYSAAASKCVATSEDMGSNDSADTVRSGWMMDRIPQYVAEMDSTCTSTNGNDWVT